MRFLLINCVVALLCFNLQLEIVLAGNKTFGPYDIHDWREASDGVGTGEFWIDSTNPERLSTTLTPNSESWFITPILQQFDVSYLDITAKPAGCDGKNCDLKIYGENKSVSQLPSKTDRKYIEDNFELITTMTFPRNKRQLMSVLIRKPYQRLCIRTTLATNKQTTWDIYSLKLYYSFCDKTIINKIDLRCKNSSESDIIVNGSCTSNSISKYGRQRITVTCTRQGEWMVGQDQKCLCKKGFGSNSSKSCSPCQFNYYKTEVSDAECNKCPDGKTNDAMNTNCQCLEDHYIGEDKSGPCYALPSKVEGLETKIVGTFVHVSWNKSSQVGGFEQFLKYSVKCYYCNQSKCDKEVNNIVFPPRETNLTTTLVNVSYFKMNETYKFKIVSINRLINVSSDKWKYAEIYFTFKLSEPTMKVPSTVPTSCPTAQVYTKINVLTIILSVVASLSVLLNIVLLGILLYKRRDQSPKLSTAGSIPAHVHTVESRQNEFVLHNYEEPYCEEINRKSFKEVPMSGRGGRSDVDEPRRNNQQKQPLTRQLFDVIAPDGETKPHETGTKNDHALQANLLADNVGYLSPVDTKTNKSQNVQISEPSAYAKLDQSLRQDERDTGDYQRLLKRDSDFVISNGDETNPGQNNPILEHSVYAKHDKSRQDTENVGNYQKLIKHDLDHGIPNDSERVTCEDVRQAKATPRYEE